MQVTKEVREHAAVALLGTLTAKDISSFYDKAVAAAVRDVAVPGFRKGHVPRERVVQEVGEAHLWKDAAERALNDELDELLKKENVVPIVPLSLRWTSDVESGKDVSFEVVATVAPTVTVGDYTANAASALAALPAVDTAKEEAAAVQAFRTQTRAIALMQSTEPVPEGTAQANAERATTPLSDEEAKKAGFENGEAAEFFIKGEAEKAVADREVQRRRSAVAEAVLKGATTSIPRLLVVDEAARMRETFKKDVAAQGLVWSEYLKRVNKTDEQVAADLTPNAEKRIALELIFAHIIREEKIELSEEDKKQEEEFAHRLAKTGVPHDRAHSYAHESYLREAVWKLLLGAKERLRKV